MSGPPRARCRIRDIGVDIGLYPVGDTNSIVDVPNVRVGQVTLWRDEPSPPEGRGVARTGVTAIVPFDAGELFGNRIPAGVAVLNGAGELIGFLTISEWGMLETPIFLTSSMAIGRVYDAAVQALVGLDARMGVDEALMPVVTECDDGLLNEARHVQVSVDDVRAALDAARGAESGPVEEGVVGSGTGMVCFGVKGGIGSASRLVRPRDRWGRVHAPGGVDAASSPDDGIAGADTSYVVGVLAMTNYGILERLTIDGVPVGAALARDGWPDARVDASAERSAKADEDPGSCIVVVATDAPLGPLQLQRLARRAGLGLARTGSYASHGSGEIFIAFSTGVRIPRGSRAALLSQETLADEFIGPFFAATVEATEEAVLNSLTAADTVVGRAGQRVEGLPLARVVEILRAHGRSAAMPPALGGRA